MIIKYIRFHPRQDVGLNTIVFEYSAGNICWHNTALTEVLKLCE